MVNLNLSVFDRYSVGYAVVNVDGSPDTGFTFVTDTIWPSAEDMCSTFRPMEGMKVIQLFKTLIYLQHARRMFAIVRVDETGRTRVSDGTKLYSDLTDACGAYIECGGQDALDTRILDVFVEGKE